MRLRSVSFLVPRIKALIEAEVLCCVQVFQGSKAPAETQSPLAGQHCNALNSDANACGPTTLATHFVYCSNPNSNATSVVGERSLTVCSWYLSCGDADPDACMHMEPSAVSDVDPPSSQILELVGACPHDQGQAPSSSPQFSKSLPPPLQAPCQNATQVRTECNQSTTNRPRQQLQTCAISHPGAGKPARAAVESDCDNDSACEYLDSFCKDLPGVRTPLVIDPRWPQEHGGGRLCFSGSAPASKQEHLPSTQTQKAAAPCNRGEAHVCAENLAQHAYVDGMQLQECAKRFQHASGMAEGVATGGTAANMAASHASEAVGKRLVSGSGMHASVVTRVPQLPENHQGWQEALRENTQCMPPMHCASSVGAVAGGQHSRLPVATAPGGTDGKVPDPSVGCRVCACPTCIQCRMAGRGACVVGESGEVVQAAYDALHALEEAHRDDDFMMDDMLFPFWELTEVRCALLQR